MLCFVLVILLVRVDLCDMFTHTLQGYITGAGAIIWSPQWQWSDHMHSLRTDNVKPTKKENKIKRESWAYNSREVPSIMAASTITQHTSFEVWACALCLRKQAHCWPSYHRAYAPRSTQTKINQSPLALSRSRQEWDIYPCLYTQNKRFCSTF